MQNLCNRELADIQFVYGFCSSRAEKNPIFGSRIMW